MQLKRHFSKGVGGAAFVAAIVLLLMGAGVEVWAQTTGATTFTPTFTGTQASPNFGLMNPSQLGFSAASCPGGMAGQALQGLTNPLIDLTSSSTKNGSACRASDAKTCVYSDPPQAPTCSNGTIFNKAAFDQAVCTAQKDASCATLKQQALTGLLSQLNCIEGQEKAVESQIRGLQSAWQSNLNTMQQNVSSIDAVVKDRVNQIQFLNNKLTGSPKGDGSGGLMGMQQQFQAAYAQIQTDALGLQSGYTALQNEQAQFQQNLQNFEMGKAQACMNTASGQYHCKLNGPPCSLVEYIQAVYYSLKRTDPSSAQNQAQSQSTASGLSALLQTIFNNMSNQTTLTPLTKDSADSLAAQQAQVSGINSPADVLNQYGAQLAAFNTGPLNVQQVFLSGLESCYEAAQNAVGAQENQPGSTVYMYMQRVSADSTSFRASVNQFTSKYSDLYNSFWTTLGMTGPVNATTCMAAATSTTGKMSCANDLTTNFEGLYTGTTPNSQVNVSVPGVSSSPPTTFTINCYGVNGCVTQFKNAINNVTQETTRLDQVKSSYIQQANSSIQSFATNMSTQISTQTSAVQSNLLSLKSQLAALGVTFQLPGGITPETLVKGQTTNSQGQQVDGLYNMPQNILAVIGGNANPPLLDLTQGGFDNAAQNVQQQIQTDQQNVSQANSAISQIKAAAATCQQEIQHKAIESVVTKANALNTQCDNNAVWCQQGGSSQLQNLQSSLAQISDDGSGLDTSSIDQALATGIGTCQASVQNNPSAGKYAKPSDLAAIKSSGGPQAYCSSNRSVATDAAQNNSEYNDSRSSGGTAGDVKTTTPWPITQTSEYQACVSQAQAVQNNSVGQQNVNSCAAQATNVNSAITSLGNSSGNANSGTGN